jgi:alkylation response protein AidB-like acyl-CoA dehydrogenase
VDFDLSDDQEALRDAAASLLDRPRWWERLRERVGPGTVVGTLPGSGDGPVSAEQAATGFDRELWEAMVDQGWLQDLGGMVEVAVLCEQQGSHLAAVPFVPTILALDAVGDPALATGEKVGCVAWSSRVTVDGGGRLSGRTDPVVFGPSADVAVVVVGDELYAVDVEQAGRPPAQPAMDRTRELGTFDFDAVPADRVGGPEAVDRLLDRAAVAVSAEMLGGAARVLDMSVEYAKDRVQFGKPIGSFQAVKHRLADALVDVEGMRSTVYYGAWCLSAGSPESALAASMAKSWCSDASRRVMAAGLQVHGGIGFTWEHDLHLYLKRSQLDQVSFGDAPWHRDRIAGLLRGRVERGEGLF